MAADESVLVGRFNGPWGVRGWVKIWSDTRPPVAIFDYQPWLVGDGGDPIEIEQWRQSGPRLVAKLKGVDSPEQATALGKAAIRVARSALPEPEPGEYYWHDKSPAFSFFSAVVNLEGHEYGQVEKMQETGAHEVLHIRGGDGLVLIPFVTGEFVHGVDLEAGRITVDWPLDWLEPE